MGYDDLDRLSTASGLWGSGSYSYDALGNITTKTEGGQTMSYHYDTSNRLTSITKEEQGHPKLHRATNSSL